MSFDRNRLRPNGLGQGLLRATGAMIYVFEYILQFSRARGSRRIRLVLRADTRSDSTD